MRLRLRLRPRALAALTALTVAAGVLVVATAPARALAGDHATLTWRGATPVAGHAGTFTAPAGASITAVIAVLNAANHPISGANVTFDATTVAMDSNGLPVWKTLPQTLVTTGADGLAARTFTNIPHEIDLHVNFETPRPDEVNGGTYCCDWVGDLDSTIVATPKLTLSTATTVARPFLASAATVRLTPVTSVNYRIERASSPNGPWTRVLADNAFFAPKAGVYYVRAVTEPLPGDILPVLRSNVVKVSVRKGAVPTWLKQLNRFRKEYGAPAAAEYAPYNSWIRLHNIYSYANHVLGHEEFKSKKKYTAKGAQAGRSSVLSQGNTAKNATPVWMNAPFHAVSMLDPEATLASFNSYKGYSGLWPITQLSLGGKYDKPKQPYVWPKRGGTQIKRTFAGEWPDPLASCPRAYNTVAARNRGIGAPFYISYGDTLPGNHVPAKVKASLTYKGKKLKVCVLTETTYKNPLAAERSLVRGILKWRHHTVAVFPLKALKKGRYKARVTASGKTTTWKFVVP